jgi:exodeoxyribonuclease-3
MKIITWNCNMAFRKKAARILAYQPDILVVPECEHPDRLNFPGDLPIPRDILWFGANPNKGLGIFSYSHFRFKLHKKYDPAYKMVIPVKVSDGHTNMMLYAIWANHPGDPDRQYIAQVWKAIHHYDRLIRAKNTILAGDFNSNTFWDRKYRVGNHSHVVDRLARKGVLSCYHLYHGQVQGKEQHPTHYLYRHKDKPYHLHYCFVSKDMAERISSVDIGSYEEWSLYSDHVPLIVTLQGATPSGLNAHP